MKFDDTTRKKIHSLCRLGSGEIWIDPIKGHRVGVVDAAGDVSQLMKNTRAGLYIQDPPYNMKVAGSPRQGLPRVPLDDYLRFTRRWIERTLEHMEEDAHLYIWSGTDVRGEFQPLPDLMLLLREFPELEARNFITLRNQRGYGTQKNWMWVRQELLQYVRGNPFFQPVYTNIPKILKGYYKSVGGRVTENLERSRSKNIRPGNVWVDIQQVFYRMEENVPGCYAQKPLRAIERILLTSSRPGDTVADFFCHSGTTLLSGELLDRRVITCDIDPIFAEIAIRRLERLRREGKTGWQRCHPFPELDPLNGSSACKAAPVIPPALRKTGGERQYRCLQNGRTEY